MSGGNSVVVVLGLLTAVASLAVEHGLWGARTSVVRGLSSCGSQALEHRLGSCGLVALRHVESSWTRD